MNTENIIPRNKGRLPSLDGWRAVSIALVLFAHCFPPTPFQEIAFYSGGLGVRVFFVISGFIITWLLLREGSLRDGISLKNFYLRRVLRIFPAYYTYLLAAWVLDRAGLIDAGPSLQQWLNLVFLANYGPCEGSTAVLWSLGVEEQFYLIWPGMFLLCRFYINQGLSLGVLTMVIAVAPVLRALSILGWLGQGHHFLLHRFSFLFQMDVIACGCAGAIVAWKWPKAVEFLARNAGAVLSLSVVLISLPYSARRIDGLGIEAVFAPSLEGFGATLLVLTSVARSNYSVFRILNLRAVIWVGVVSYSLYLWHSIFAFGLLAKLGIPQYLWIGVSLTVAVASYYFVETPFLRMRKTARS